MLFGFDRRLSGHRLNRRPVGLPLLGFVTGVNKAERLPLRNVIGNHAVKRIQRSGDGS
jgi:hypothetical protein